MGCQLEIQPRELKFTVELNKQSKCSVTLRNKTDQYLAFKVKTTSPKKYCVRPNVGVIQPNGVHEFLVIMQAMKTIPADVTCRDKFLVQCTIVPDGTVEEEITSEMFSKDGVRHVEEMKMRVNLVVQPPPSPELSPINGTVKQVDEHVESKTVNNENLKPVKDADVSQIQDIKVEPIKKGESDLIKQVEFEPIKQTQFEPIKQVEPEPVKSVNSSALKDTESEVAREIQPMTRNFENPKVTESRIQMSEEEKRLSRDVEEMKSKLLELDSKLNKAEATISNLTEERRLVIQERETLKQEMAILRMRKVERRVQDGFPLLFVCMVALISLIAGYGFHP